MITTSGHHAAWMGRAGRRPACGKPDRGNESRSQNRGYSALAAAANSSHRTVGEVDHRDGNAARSSKIPAAAGGNQALGASRARDAAAGNSNRNKMAATTRNYHNSRAKVSHSLAMSTHNNKHTG